VLRYNSKLKREDALVVKIAIALGVVALLAVALIRRSVARKRLEHARLLEEAKALLDFEVDFEKLHFEQLQRDKAQSGKSKP